MSIVDVPAPCQSLDPLDRRLLDDYQRGFPLVSRPYAAMARKLHTEERVVIDRLERLVDAGCISRIGPVVRPRTIGASTLAALTVPEPDIEPAAAIINEYPEVNHNYAREHELNLWFVVTAASATRLQAILDDVERRCGSPVISLPLEREFRIDLGFPLWSEDEVDPRAGDERSLSRGDAARSFPQRAASGPERRLVAAVQDGLSLIPRPFARVAGALGESEGAVLDRLRTLLADGFIRRFGVVVRHHELGYRANAMVVWDVPDDLVATTGERLGRYRGVTLCYQRPRRPPRWPYNLFCMIHGRNRADVVSHVASMRRRCGLEQTPFDILFSRRRFRQRGARYTASSGQAETGIHHG